MPTFRSHSSSRPDTRPYSLGGEIRRKPSMRGNSTGALPLSTAHCSWISDVLPRSSHQTASLITVHLRRRLWSYITRLLQGAFRLRLRRARLLLCAEKFILKVLKYYFLQAPTCAIISIWGISAVGSAPHWQCGGHGFKSRMLHFKTIVFTVFAAHR